MYALSDPEFSIPQELTVHVHRSRRKTMTCFRCGEVGHYKNECLRWKTMPCRRPNCMGKENCMFAHPDEPLRNPAVRRCVRVIKVDGQFQIIGCGRAGHTFHNCPFNHVRS